MGPFKPIFFPLGAVLTESGAVLDRGRFQLGPFWLATRNIYYINEMNFIVTLNEQ